MKTVNVSELEGAALDWAAAKAVGQKVVLDRVPGKGGLDVMLSASPIAYYSPSTDWSQGGPLIEPHWLMIDVAPDGETEAKAYLKDGSHWTCFGPTPLIAICRAIVGVHAKKGTIEVPEELL